MTEEKATSHEYKLEPESELRFEVKNKNDKIILEVN